MEFVKLLILVLFLTLCATFVATRWLFYGISFDFDYSDYRIGFSYDRITQRVYLHLPMFRWIFHCDTHHTDKGVYDDKRHEIAYNKKYGIK
jgi:hypothetical protein